MAKDKKESKYAQVAKTSDAAVIQVLRKVTSTRNARAFFMRKSTAKLMERLSDSEQDAMIQIAAAWNIMGSSHGYRQMRYGEASGKSVAEHSTFAIEIINRFRAWHEFMNLNEPESIGVTIGICSDSHTVYTASRMEPTRHWNTIMGLLRTGLREWIKLQLPERRLTANDNYV